MSKVFIEETTLTNIGTAIREKTGKTDLIAPGDMPAEIRGIVSGGGSDDCNGLHIPEEALTINADKFTFAYNVWNWFLEETKGKLNITTATGSSLFYQSTSLKEFPDFTIKVKRSSNTTAPVDILDATFTGCSNLGKMPNIYIGRDPDTQIVPWVIIKKMAPLGDFGDKQCIFFEDDTIIKGFAYDSFQNYKGDYPAWLFELTNIDWDYMRANTSTFGGILPVNWNNAYYIRNIPVLKDCYVTHTVGGYYTPWYSLNLQGCYSLEEVILPRPGTVANTSNQLTSDFNRLFRLKSFTFDVQEDGTPYTANWRNQIIDLTLNTGYGPLLINVPNTEFTNEDKITTPEQWRDYIDGTYPNGWSDRLEYSTFGKTSAIELINTLPDTSAYGTNTVKFKSGSASAIEGENISDLPEEVIAVATAKGWTITFV